MKAMSTAASTLRHTVQALFEAFLIVAVVAALAFGVGLATGHPAGAGSVFAKGNNGGGGGGAGSTGTVNSITVLAPTNAAAVAYTYRSTVGTFSTYDASLTQVYADVSCVANSSTVTSLAFGSTVYDVMVPLQQGTWSSGGYGHFATTASSAWTGGGASCTAALLTFTYHNYTRNWQVLASTPFSVQP